MKGIKENSHKTFQFKKIQQHLCQNKRIKKTLGVGSDYKTVGIENFNYDSDSFRDQIELRF